MISSVKVLKAFTDKLMQRKDPENKSATTDDEIKVYDKMIRSGKDPELISKVMSHIIESMPVTDVEEGKYDLVAIETQVQMVQSKACHQWPSCVTHQIMMLLWHISNP